MKLLILLLIFVTYSFSSLQTPAQKHKSDVESLEEDVLISYIGSIENDYMSEPYPIYEELKNEAALKLKQEKANLMLIKLMEQIESDKNNNIGKTEDIQQQVIYKTNESIQTGSNTKSILPTLVLLLIVILLLAIVSAAMNSFSKTRLKRTNSKDLEIDNTLNTQDDTKVRKNIQNEESNINSDDKDLHAIQADLAKVLTNDFVDSVFKDTTIVTKVDSNGI